MSNEILDMMEEMRKKNGIISSSISEITHLLIDRKVRHVQYLTLEIANQPVEPVFSQWQFLESSKRKIHGGEYDGYFEGKAYTYKYIKYLD